MSEQLEQSEMDVKSEIVDYLEGLNVGQLETVRDVAAQLCERNSEAFVAFDSRNEK